MLSSPQTKNLIPAPVLHTWPLQVNSTLGFQTALPPGCTQDASQTTHSGTPLQPRAASHTCCHKEDSRTEDNIVLAAVDPPSADAEPSEQEQNGAEDGKDTGSSHDA